jgi:hypothetical protein
MRAGRTRISQRAQRLTLHFASDASSTRECRGVTKNEIHETNETRWVVCV